MGKIITVSNQKGGVGKTTTAFNVAAGLTNKGKKVLLVDLDPQANLSDYLGFEGGDVPTISNLIAETASKSIISKETVSSAIIHNDVINADYIPSDINLANAELFMINAISRETVLKRILHSVVDEYDYIIIDCLPSLGVLLINALTAANEVLIPVQTQKFSVDGLENLLNVFEQIKATVNPSLELAGILPTMVDNTKISRSAYEMLLEKYGEKVFDVTVHRSVDAAKSSEAKKSISASSKLGADYTALVEEILSNE